MNIIISYGFMNFIVYNDSLTSTSRQRLHIKQRKSANCLFMLKQQASAPQVSLM